MKTKSQDTVTGKEKINVFYNHEKGGVDSHDQMCALYTTARKTNCWPMRVFYGIVDSFALNAFAIFTHNIPGFGENRKDKRKKFLKKLSKSLVFPQAKRRLVTPQTPQVVNKSFAATGFYQKHVQLFKTLSSIVHQGERDAFFV